MSKSKYVNNITSENFDALVLKASQRAPVLVDFWAEWCGPCQALTPILEKLAEDYGGKITVAKVNTDEQQPLAYHFGIRSLPTVMVFNNGQVVDQFMGAQPESVIRQIIDRHIEKPIDRQLAQAQAMLAAGKADQAVALLEQAVAENPDNHEITLALANAHLAAGAVVKAKELLEGLPLNARQSDAAKKLEARLTFADAIADAPDLKALTARVETAPDDLKARYQFGVKKVLAGDYETGLDQLLEILRRNRNFEDNLGRKSLLAAFEIIDNPELVGRYRKRMASLLF